MAVRIMVVDDEPAIGKLLVYQLGGVGYQVSYVENGMLALERFLLEQPDLILLDVMMPQVSGWEVCEQIRACSTTPVIMLTAKSADLDIVTGLNAGADDYISKPFSMPLLQARIEAVLRRNQRRQMREVRSDAPPQRSQPSSLVRSSFHTTTMESYRRSVPPALTRSHTERSLSTAAPTSRLGQRIYEERIARGLSLQQVEQACRIRWEFLQAIEQENWSYIPRAQLREHVRTYIRYLNLDPRDLSSPTSAPSPKYWPFVAIWSVAFVLLMVLGFYLF